MNDYAAFLEQKAIRDPATGLAIIPPLNPALFPFQQDIVRWALRRGRAAIFADCGLGKTPMQLEWAHHVPGRVLILAPLAVSAQTVREAHKFDISDVQYAREGDKTTAKIVVTNYEMLPHFDPSEFTGIVLDESSILKAYDGKTRTAIIEAFEQTPFRLACTATPAPNDYMELGNHAEFLGTLSRAEMLSTYFVHDGGETQKWRLKGHAQQDFWKWLCSWAVSMRKPSDLGYSDEGWILPPLEYHEHTVHAETATDGYLFALPAATLQDRISARRNTLTERVREAVSTVASDASAWIVWCNLNAESAALAAMIPDAVEVTGSDSIAFKEAALRWFTGEVCKCQLPKRSGNTTASGIRKTDNTLPPIGNVQPTHEMRDVENSTRQTMGDAKQLVPLPSNSEKQTPGVISDIDSRPLASACQTLNAFCESKVEDVQSAGAQKTPVHVTQDCTSIIVMDVDSSEAFSAINVISDLENSEMIQPDLKKRPCTCGGIKDHRILISKSSICGFGLNWQHCPNVAFVGLSDSWEAYYQAVRRCWRFGQKQPVHVHVITANTEGAVLANIKRKEADATKMGEEMLEHMRDLNEQALHGATLRQRAEYATEMVTGDGWTLELGDCVDGARKLASDSIHYSIFSPPFTSLYTYSASDRDMGNCRNDQVFFDHFGFLIDELYRVIMPGRLLSFHCMNLPTSKQNHGYIGIRDFRGDLIRLFEKRGFIYHSEVVIWKDPVTAMQRTKALGLLHKQLKKDSCMSRQGIPDYLVTMRKPGDNPERVEHTAEDFPVQLWQNYASPVWMDINPSETLQFRSAREHNDERHICPLQLEVIRRALKLWTNANDLVLSPFAGIGSEGYCALQANRRFLGIELKRSYWEQAKRNLERARQDQGTMFVEEVADE